MTPLYSKQSRRLIAEINVVPFIDVMLVLLVIFMITTPLLTEGVKVNLPKTDSKTLPKADQEPLIVTVDASGNYYLNIAEKPNKAIPARTLSTLVTDALRTGRDTQNKRPVLVRGDQSVPYGRMMDAMTILQQAGAKEVGLITQPPAQKAHP